MKIIRHYKVTLKEEDNMSKFVQANKKIAEGATKSYKTIEKGVTTGYKKIEKGVTSTYTKIEDKFVDTFLRKENETIDEAKKRITDEQKNRKGA